MPGSIIASALLLTGVQATVVAFAINMVVSSIIAKSLGAENAFTNDNQNNPNPGNRQQIPPATDNKLPVVYGSAYLGGVVTDLTISNDNQTLYYCLSLSEVTNSENGGTGDVFTFGDVYWGGKRCIFDPVDQTKVISLYDESTGEAQTNVEDNLFIYLYRNGSYTPTNGTVNAVDVMSDPDLVYKWDSNKPMTNCAFAIVKVIYNQDAGLTGIQQTRFQVNNPRTSPGDCLADYLKSSRYGAALTAAQVDTTSLTALNAYCAGTFNYTDAAGGAATQTRFKFDGVIDTAQTVMNNLQQMAASCDCLLRYNEITSQWGVIVQSPTYTTALAINDSNMVSAIQITPTDLSSSPNIIETKFANSTEKDTFSSAAYSLSQLNPSLLYPNEPVNKQSVSLSLVNNDVRAQYIAVRLLKAGREDLIVQVTISYVGLQLEAGDVISLTSANYGWTNKLFRLSKVVENFSDDGQITASLTLLEFNPSVFDDQPINAFKPAPNTGIPSPLVFGTIYAPTIANQSPNAANPSFGIAVTASSAGVSQYAEVWYSAFSSPTSTQRIFAGTTAVRASGNPYLPNTSMGTVQITNIPQGNWYFFARMVNSLGTSKFSTASSLLQWRPTTFQFIDRYIVMAFADDIVGTGISSNPRMKSYFGLWNVDTSPAYSSDPDNYTWYLAQPTFGVSVYPIYANRQNRKFSFDSDFAAQAAGTAAWVPLSTAQFDPSLWAALPDGTNVIDLDVRTGQLLTTGTTTTGNGEIAVTNNQDGRVVAQLSTFLDFGPGVSQYTSAVAQLTIDKYGRVVGFAAPDDFGYTLYEATATASQTVFTPTARGADYFADQCLVFRNGFLLDEAEYTDTTTTTTLSNACAAGDIVSIISMSAQTNGNTYVNTGLTVQTVATTVVTYDSATTPWQLINVGDKITFVNTGTPTEYTVTAINYTTRQITFSATVTGVVAGALIYVYRAANTAYRPMSRWSVSLSAQSAYTPTTWSFMSGFEKLYLNGSGVNDIDYDLTTTLSFTQNVSGLLTVIQFAPNILTTPVGAQSAVATSTVIGQQTYNFDLNIDAFELYYNGPLQDQGTDYTIGTGSYTLASSPSTSASILQQVTYNRTGAA